MNTLNDNLREINLCNHLDSETNIQCVAPTISDKHLTCKTHSSQDELSEASDIHICEARTGKDKPCTRKKTELINDMYLCSIHKKYVKIDDSIHCFALTKAGEQCTRINVSLIRDMQLCSVHKNYINPIDLKPCFAITGKGKQCTITNTSLINGMDLCSAHKNYINPNDLIQCIAITPKKEQCTKTNTTLINDLYLCPMHKKYVKPNQCIALTGKKIQCSRTKTELINDVYLCTLHKNYAKSDEVEVKISKATAKASIPLNQCEASTKLKKRCSRTKTELINDRYVCLTHTNYDFSNGSNKATVSKSTKKNDALIDGLLNLDSGIGGNTEAKKRPNMTDIENKQVNNSLDDDLKDIIATQQEEFKRN